MKHYKKTKKGLNYCSPEKLKRHTKTKRKFNTCYTKDNLKSIIKKWNKKNPNDKIKFNKSNTIKTLWKKINMKLNNQCNSEWCWINKTLKSNKLLKHTFRPLKPKSWKKNPREWLTNIDIEKVLHQYEDSHSEFEFIGPVPIDFNSKIGSSCISDELCHINIKTLLDKGIRKIGIIFNEDKHNQPGSHWIALFIDIDRKGIYYFNSVGDIYGPEVKKLINTIKKQCKQLNINMNIDYNRRGHQWKDTECGVYCLYFIKTMLITNISFKKFYNKVIYDDDMFKNRNHFFINN